nr:beta-ketoacyl-[acyl-carrier-protein] synthase II [Opitutaceae bacterium]
MDSSSSRRIVITGLGVVASVGHTVDEFWAGLLAGKCGIGRVTHFDPTAFATQIGAEVRDWDPALHMDPKEVRRNDRFTHFAFVAAK